MIDPILSPILAVLGDVTKTDSEQELLALVRKWRAEDPWQSDPYRDSMLLSFAVFVVETEIERLDREGAELVARLRGEAE